MVGVCFGVRCWLIGWGICWCVCLVMVEFLGCWFGLLVCCLLVGWDVVGWGVVISGVLGCVIWSCVFYGVCCWVIVGVLGVWKCCDVSCWVSFLVLVWMNGDGVIFVVVWLFLVSVWFFGGSVRVGWVVVVVNGVWRICWMLLVVGDFVVVVVWFGFVIVLVGFWYFSFVWFSVLCVWLVWIVVFSCLVCLVWKVFCCCWLIVCCWNVFWVVVGRMYLLGWWGILLVFVVLVCFLVLVVLGVFWCWECWFCFCDGFCVICGCRWIGYWCFVLVYCENIGGWMVVVDVFGLGYVVVFCCCCLDLGVSWLLGDYVIGWLVLRVVVCYCCGYFVLFSLCRVVCVLRVVFWVVGSGCFCVVSGCWGGSCCVLGWNLVVIVGGGSCYCLC